MSKECPNCAAEMESGGISKDVKTKRHGVQGIDASWFVGVLVLLLATVMGAVATLFVFLPVLSGLTLLSITVLAYAVGRITLWFFGLLEERGEGGG